MRVEVVAFLIVVAVLVTAIVTYITVDALVRGRPTYGMNVGEEYYIHSIGIVGEDAYLIMQDQDGWIKQYSYQMAELPTGTAAGDIIVRLADDTIIITSENPNKG